MPGDKPKGKDLSDMSLTGKNYENEILDYATFETSNLKGAKFTGASLKGAVFKGANLRETVFTGANLTGANFREAQVDTFTWLDRTNMTKAILGGELKEGEEGTDFSNLNLREVNMRSADLRNIKGLGAITEVDFTGADFCGANLTLMISHDKKSIFRGAKYDKKTRWHKDFDPVAAKCVLVPEEKKK